jgi:subtilase family serine protease
VNRVWRGAGQLLVGLVVFAVLALVLGISLAHRGGDGNPASAHVHGPKSTASPSPTPSPSPSPSRGLTASDLRNAYGIAGTGAAGRTVAIVDAMDDPNAEADLAVYRAAMGLPPCTTANGCFRKVNAAGGTAGPAPDAGWSREIALDLDMVSAACSDCHILLLEAASQDIPALGAAEDSAARTPGVVAISNSFGVAEQAQETSWDVHFNHPGIAITVASGDSGFGTLYPASSPYVVAVGGTSLARDSSPRGWAESAWTGSGSGCSSFEPKPAWQTDTGCAHRAIADVASVADPTTGVAVYDSYQAAGWLQAGGTSAAAPFVAGLYALAGTVTAAVAPGAYLYAHAAGLHDVTRGANTLLCLGNYLCGARPGYDGPTGLGSPAGLGAF